jgi:hypothetical protein
MKYVCLIYLPAGEDFDHYIGAQFDYDETLRKSGHLVTNFALERLDQATSVRTRNGKMSATDGPFAETKEILGGLYVVEAKDREEAHAIAGKIPLAEVGTIEVRPIRELTRP